MFLIILVALRVILHHVISADIPIRFILLLSLCLPPVTSSLTYFLFLLRRAVLLEDAWAGPKVGRVGAAD